MKVLLVHIAGRRAWPARRGLAVKVTALIHATVLMFVVGIIKYAERTYSLYSGSVDGFRNKILDPPEPGTNYAKLMTEFDSKKKAGLVVEIDIANGQAEQAHKEMEKQETTRLVQDKWKEECGDQLHLRHGVLTPRCPSPTHARLGPPL
jgi:hypothetical protein